MAPPTKATAEIIARIEEALEDGASLSGAARRAGISVRTLHRWMKRGIRPDAPAALSRARETVHRARREAGVVVVRTPRGIALRRRAVRRMSLEALLRETMAEGRR